MKNVGDMLGALCGQRWPEGLTLSYGPCGVTFTQERKCPFKGASLLLCILLYKFPYLLPLENGCH